MRALARRTAGAASTVGNGCIQTVGCRKNIPPEISALAPGNVGRSCFISAGPPAGRIMPPMTQARTRANEVGSPSPSQLSLTAMLRAFVELVLHAASTLWMRWCCLSRDWHAGEAATALPEATSGIQPQEVQPDRRAPARLSAHRAETTLTLMVSGTRSVRSVYPELVEGSNQEGGLTALRSEPLGSGPKVRVPREGGDPAITSPLVPTCRCSHTAEKAASPALDPRLRGGHGRESLRTNSAPA